MIAKLLGLEKRLILFDLETTGVEPIEQVRICQIGMRVHKPDGTIRSYKTLIDPEIDIPEHVAAASHRITNEIIGKGCAFCKLEQEEHPHEGCPEFRVIPAFKDIAAQIYPAFQDAHFSGYNVKNFDLRVIREEFRRANFDFDYSTAKILDPSAIWRLLERRTLTDAYRRFCNKELEGAHDAAVDVMATEEVLIAMLEAYRGSKLPHTIEEIHDLCYPRKPGQIDSEGKFIFIKGVPCFNFGKWKGSSMASQRGYLKWMVEGNFPPEVKKICEEALAGNFPQEKPVGQETP